MVHRVVVEEEGVQNWMVEEVGEALAPPEYSVELPRGYCFGLVPA